MWEIREDFVQEKTIVSRADEEIRVERGGAGSARVHKDFVVERLVHLRNRRPRASGWSPGKIREVVPYGA